MISSPVWAVPRGTEGVRIMVDGGAAHGMTTRECLAGTGLNAEDLHDEHALIWAHQEFAVIRNILGRLGGCPWLWFEIGAHSTNVRSVVIGLIMLPGPTVREAIERAIPYLALSPTHLRVSLVEAGDRYAYAVGDDDEIPRNVSAFVVER